jgi:hypothetical protein
MSTDIPAVQGNVNITHAVFLDIQLGSTNTYHISSAYQQITLGSTVYQPSGAFLRISDLTEDLKTTNGDIQISLSGIPAEYNYMNIILNTPIKGGTVEVKRGFFNPETLELLPSDVYTRYKGVITNFSIDETTNFLNGELTNQITVTCASINTLLENRVRGQRTNGNDRRKFYPGDISFDRVKDLKNVSFDFGREYTGGQGYGGGGGPGGPGRFPGFNFQMR